MQPGEVFFPEKSNWVKADMWTAKNFLKDEENKRKLLLKVYSRDISKYISLKQSEKPIGKVFKLIIRIYSISLSSLAVVFTREQWPEMFTLKEKLDNVKK